MKLNFKRQVDTRVSIVVVIVVLAIVQAAWWKGLIWKPTARPPGPRQGGPPMRPEEPQYQGRKDVIVDTFAGAGEPGESDGIGRHARFDGPVGLAADADGNIFVADSRNNRIRKISKSGRVETIAGSEAGFADGPVQTAKFTLPSGVAALPDGTILVADSGNHRVRAIKNGNVTTLAGGERGYADGLGAAARFDTPIYIDAVKGGSSIFVSDALNKKLRAISPAGATTTSAWNGGTPAGLADVRGLTAASPDTGKVVENGTAKTLTIESSDVILRKPFAVCPSKTGYYASFIEQGALLEVVNGKAEVIAGSCMKGKSLRGIQDGTGEKCRFGTIAGIAYDGKNHIFVSDVTNNTVRRITLPAENATDGNMGRS